MCVRVKEERLPPAEEELGAVGVVLCTGLCWARVGTGVTIVIDAGGGVGGHRVGVEDGVGPAAAPRGVAG